ncbi:hypothetical protein [Stenotrophomonas sp.]|uniref:hypothetical protein n=1 Tax=Stenotrophomonas sp. TaxID=69392 RepID=UPI0028AD0AE6|nr:hypothetical protein [Stenotrophomonas sp.]
MDGEGCGQVRARLGLQCFQIGGEFFTNAPKYKQANFCRSGVSREAGASPGCISALGFRNASIVADATPTTGHLFHNDCAQSMEKAVDKPAQPLHDKGFKNVVKI